MANTQAIVLPGGGYTSLGPAIRFPVLALKQLGATVRDVTYPEITAPTLDAVAWETVGSTVAGQIQRFVSDGDWGRVIVVAKSFGTSVLARIGPRLVLPDPRAIWITPLFRSSATRAGAIALHWPSLLVAGTADDLHDADGFDEVRASLEAQSLVIAGADHGMEIPSDAAATAAAMGRLVQATLDFASM
jgi:hypothetical protein